MDDCVVAKHPQYSGSYALGKVVSIEKVLQEVEVKFYDGEKSGVPRAETYSLVPKKYDQGLLHNERKSYNEKKYEHDVLYIQQRQRAMLGLSAVALDDTTGEYYPGNLN